MAGDIHVNLGRFSNGIQDFRDKAYNPLTKSAKAIKSYSGGKNSVTALSKDLIMQFPVLMSASIPMEHAATIATSLQRQYASLHLAIWSADTAFGIDSSQNGIRDFIRRYHNNDDIPDMITYGGNLLTNAANIAGALAHENVGSDSIEPTYSLAVENVEFLTEAKFTDPNEILSLWDIPELKFATESINDLYDPNTAVIDTINDIAEALEAAKKTPQQRYASYSGETKRQKSVDKLNAKKTKYEAAQTSKDDAEIKRQMDKYGKIVDPSKITRMGGSMNSRLKNVNDKLNEYNEMDQYTDKVNPITGKVEREYKYGSYGYPDGSYKKSDYGVHPKFDATPKEREAAYRKEQREANAKIERERNSKLVDAITKNASAGGIGNGRSYERKNTEIAKFVQKDKLSSLEPTLMDVSFLVHGKANGGMVGNTAAMPGGGYTAHAVVGVKCMVRLISPELMIPNIISSCQDSSLAFKFIKWTKGEMKVMKDMVFNISQIKEDARAKNTADKWFAALRKRKRNAKAFKFGGDTGINPFCTLVITSEDALQIRESSGYDLYDLQTARKLMDNLYLLGFMIVNPSTGLVSTLYDGYGDFEDTTLKALKIGNDSKDPTDQMLEIMKRMNRI